MRFADSIAAFKEAVDVSRKVFGPTHPSTFDSLEGLASAYNLNGQRDKSIDTLQGMVNAGYADSTSLEDDQDLKSLTTDVRFDSVLKQAKRNNAASAQHVK